jgi:hypothetical protein
MDIRRAVSVVAVFASFAALAGCGGDATPASGSASPATTASATAANPQAASVVTGMKTAGAPVTLAVTYTAQSDVNHLLGRPGQYTSKAAFTDARVEGAASAGKGDVEAGGGVECLDNKADTEKRAAYVATISQSASMFAEYDWVAGDCLLRLSRYLTPEQASTNVAAFSKVLGVPAVEATAVSVPAQ